MNPMMMIFRTVKKCARLDLRTLNIPKQQFRRMSTSASISELQREKDTFQDVLPNIFETLENNSKFTEIPEMADWTKRVLEYNLHGGKKNRGLMTTYAYENIEDPQNITEESLRISRVVGWCLEMLHAYFLVMDDIMDGSTKRRGVPCWYQLPNIGLGAINDAILIQACIYEVLYLYCKDMPQYKHIVDLINEGLLYTSVGQHLDYTMAHRSKNDYSLFTPERYSSIVKYKTSYYTFKMPVCLGLLLANKLDPNTHKQTEKICFEIGHLFQMQDDFIDCFGVEKVTGKVGTDIQEGKCSWLAVQAIQRCNEKQMRVFSACYGSSEPAHIERIKRLYEELDLPTVYRNEEKARHDSVVRLVHDFPSDTISPDLFLKLLNRIYDRKK